MVERIDLPRVLDAERLLGHVPRPQSLYVIGRPGKVFRVKSVPPPAA